MDPLIYFNAVVYGVACIASLWGLRQANRRRWIRLAGAFIAGYPLTIYLLVVAGYIPDTEVRLYMRWFQLAIGAYLLLEAKHG
jgi:hypothetical protein